MSQDKTIVPGSEFIGGGSQSGGSLYDNLYRPSGYASNRTFIEGNSNPQVEASLEKANELTSATGKVMTIQERVVVGVLFSRSRGILGEIFPLYLGRNRIGSSPLCDQVLREDTVSSEHALIHVRKSEDKGKYEITITDYGSTFGTSLNDSDVRYETMTINDNDELLIGHHYRFLVKIFESDKTNLCEDPGFIEIDTHNPQSEANTSTLSNDYYTQTEDESGIQRTVMY